MPEMKNTLGWINGKLDITEGRICELKHAMKELYKMKHTEKFKNFRNRKAMSCRTTSSFLIYVQ